MIASNKKEYLISIVIPTFNVEKTIENAFNSIFKQTIGFENLEIIFVDDASKDETRNKILEYSKNFENVKNIILSNNSGFPGKPRNIGIKHSTAKYIMFLDADDEYFLDACESLYNKIKLEKCNLISGNFIQIKNNKEHLKKWDFLNIKNGELKIKNISEKLDLFYVAPSVWTKIYDKDFLLKNNLYFVENLPAEDLIFVSEALINAKNIIFLDKPVIYYIERDYSTNSQKAISDDNTKEQLSLYLKTYDITYNFVKDYFFNEKPTFIFYHLIYWFKLLNKSGLKQKTKIDLLYESLPLFERFENIEKDMNENDKKIKDCIINKRFEVLLENYNEVTEN